MTRLGYFLLIVGLLPVWRAQAQTPTAPAMPPASVSEEGESRRVVAQDFLDVAAGADSSGSGSVGRNASVDWIRSREQGTTFSAGLSSFWAADSQWSFGKGSAAFRPTDRLLLEAQARIGGGHTGSTPFAYRVFNGGVTYRAASRLYLRISDEQLRIGQTHGNLVRPGLVVRLAPQATADFTYTRSVSGNVDSAYFTSRLDLATQSAGFFGGFTAGRTTPEVFDLHVGHAPTRQALRSGYLGMRVAVSQTEWTLVSEFTSVGATRKRAVTLSVRLPLWSGGRQ